MSVLLFGMGRNIYSIDGFSTDDYSNRRALLKRPTSRITLKTFLFLTFVVFLYMTGWIAHYIYNGVVLNIITEFFVVCLFVFLLALGRIRVGFPGIWCLLCCFFWTIVSGVYNGSSFEDVYLHSRYFIDTYIIFLFLANVNFQPREVKQIVGCFSFLFLFQIFASVINVCLYGFVEANVGSLSSTGGGPGTVFPLVAVAFALGFYFYKYKRWWMFVIAISFIFIGISNGKRAICITFPLIVIIAFVVNAYLNRSFDSAIKTVTFLVFLIPAFFLAGILILERMDKFESLQSESTLSAKINLAYDIGNDYSNSDGEKGGLSVSRGEVIRIMLSMIFEGYDGFFFGEGPMTTSARSGEVGFVKYGIGYGAGGWVYDAVSIGVPGMIFHVLFYLFLTVGLYKRISLGRLNPTGQALYFGVILSVFGLMFIHFFYNTLLSVGILMQLPSVCAAALLLSPYHYFDVIR